MSKIVAIIQARMGSTRLPGKIMMDLCGKTVLEHVIIRVKQSKLIDEIVIATTVKQDDDIIVKEAERLGVKHFRGSEEDVLSRYYYAARENDADIVVRITSDCPVIDADIIDKMMINFKKLYKSEIDYMSNTLERTFPRGLDAEIIRFETLKKVFEEARKQFEREHVTPYIYQNPDKFKLIGFKNEIDYSSYRWTLDTSEDFQAITKIYEQLYFEKKIFWLNDIIDLIDRNPEIKGINEFIEQKKLGEK
ncbi:cytidylyltransferase domain-containing protein [Alkaliphilus oremlandii]|uniref:Acylneuraminate cytidylyltransferase n=1 Tax=Alkaliphilus oremlandii (strain OhILAs) TaxID=350688 RepID=A8MJR2_ALKOO|nr:glycosyltransferase family protein [Alkaliphilus oremlandii]ABW20044.1 acylneuraminate cytidylyltransferase [Alkaliphilus oremlandii OhILAs]